MRGCSTSHETSHYKNSCGNPGPDFDDDDPGIVVSARDLFSSTPSVEKVGVFIDILVIISDCCKKQQPLVLMLHEAIAVPCFLELLRGACFL